MCWEIAPTVPHTNLRAPQVTMWPWLKAGTIIIQAVAGYPCLLARLRVVLHKDGVRGREVQSPDAGLSLA